MLSRFCHVVSPKGRSRAGGFATVVQRHVERTRTPQTLIEKIVQKYAVDLPQGKHVKAGDYVMIRPEHCMTHDNTAAVMKKYG